MEASITWAPADSQDHEIVKRAVTDGDVQRLESALKPNINVNALYGDGTEGHTLLHEAALRGHVDVIRHLLAHGAHVDVRDENQFGASTPLFYAARRAEVGATRVLLDAGANISIRGSNDNNVLTAVLPDAMRVTQNQINTIDLLLARGFDVNSRTSAYGPSVVEQAIKAANHDLIQLLLDGGATLEGSLGIAAEFNDNADTVNFLIDHGAKDTNSYALSRAACWNKLSIAAVLLARTGEPASTGSGGALHMAALMGHVDMVTLFLDSGLNINARDDLGRTPLLAACGADRPLRYLVQTLLDRRADINARTIEVAESPYQGGDTPLHACAWRSDIEIVRLLLHAGADVSSRNDAGETVLFKFAQKLTNHTLCAEDTNPRLETFRTLLVAGSDVNAKDNQGRTMLHILTADRFSDRDGNRVNVARLLLARGIDVAALDAEGKAAADLLRPEDKELAQLLGPRTQALHAVDEM